jgi:nucleoside-diphosphate-sugar epimerase
MKTLIIGCGYLGRRVGRLLRARGDVVLATTRSAAKAAELEAQGFEPVVFDVTRVGSASGLPRVERTVFCVGFDRTSGATFGEVHEGGLRHVLGRLGRLGALVYTSSTGVYGGAGGTWVDEATPPAPTSPSGAACLGAEGWVREWAEGWRVGATVLRLAGLYGPGRIIRRQPLMRGEPIAGDPEKHVNLVHVEDAASAVVAALDRTGPVVATYNVADDRPPTRRELYALTARLIGAPEPTFVPSESDEPDKRVSNRRMKAGLGVALRYPDIATGLPAAMAEEGTP